MANMSQSDRNAMERASAGNESMLRTKDGSKTGMTVFLVIGVIILIALSYAAIDAIHGWDHIIVIADLIILTAAIAWFVRGRRENVHEAAVESETEGGWRPGEWNKGS